MVSSAEAQLLGSKAYVGIGYTRQLFDFVFHFGSAVSTAKVLQNIYALNFIGIRHTAGAISQAFAAYIAVLLMRMADFAITVSRMTGNVMSVYMSMFVAVVMSAATLVTVCVSMFMLVAVVVFVIMLMLMLVVVFMIVVVFMLVAMAWFILLRRMRGPLVNAEFDAGDGVARLALEVHVEAAQVDLLQLPLQRGGLHPEVAKRPHGHVAADSRKAVEIENAHRVKRKV